MDQLSTILLDRIPVVIPVVIVLTSIFVVTRFLDNGYSKIPLLGHEYGNSEQRRKTFLKSAAQLYRKGYAEFKDSAFKLTTADGRARNRKHQMECW